MYSRYWSLDVCKIHRVSCATSAVRGTDTSSDSQGTRHFTILSDTSALKTFPLRGSVANELSTVWPSRSVRLNSDLNCRKIGSGNCPMIAEPYRDQRQLLHCPPPTIARDSA